MPSSSAAPIAALFHVAHVRRFSARAKPDARPRGDGRQRASASAAEGPSCLFVGPVDTASKEMLEALYQQARYSYYNGKPLIVDDMFDKVELKLRLYGSKSVIKYPRCSLRQQSTYADAEEDPSQVVALASVWILLFVFGSSAILVPVIYAFVEALNDASQSRYFYHSERSPFDILVMANVALFIGLGFLVGYPIASASVRTCKEAKRTAIAKSISAAISRSELLEKNVQDQRARKDEFATLISQQFLFLGAFEDKSNEDMNETKNIEEAIMWYKRVLGFRTEGGEGVKFIFNNIDLKNADEEYAFTVRLDGDIYKLMNCELRVEDINDLIKDLNKTNDLFKFVRIMRERFQAAALNVLTTKSSVIQDSTSITISSPPPFSVDSRNETPLKENVPHSLPKKPRLKSHQKVIPGQVAAPSPQSISNCRRSPRFVDKIFP